MNNFIKHTSLLTLSGVATRLVSLLFFVILARSLSVSEYGLFRYLITLSAMYGILFTGLPISLTKFIGARKWDEASVAQYTTDSWLLMFTLFVLVSIVIGIFSHHVLYILLFLFALLIDSAYLGFIRGLLDYVKLSGFKLVENVIQLMILLVAYITFGTVNLSFSVIFYSFSGVISLMLFEILRPKLRIVKTISMDKIKNLLKYTAPVTVGAVSWTVMTSVNAIFIERFQGTEAVAFYSVALTLVQVLAFVPDAIMTIMLPKVAGLKTSSGARKPVLLSLIVSLVSSVLLLVPLLAFKELILDSLFTVRYDQALVLILPLALSQIFLSLHQILASVWQGMNKPGIPTMTISIAAISNLILAYVLTKSEGILGSSVAIAATSLLAFVLILLLPLLMGQNVKLAVQPSDSLE